jgi:hypothetical protein
VPISIRKIQRPLALRGLAEEYGEDFISVWVNPPRAMLEAYAAAKAESQAVTKRMHELASQQNEEISQEDRQAIAARLLAVNERFFDWFAQIWSQSENAATHVTAADVRDLAIRAETDDPALWEFLVHGTWRLIDEHRQHAKKG